VWKSPEAAILNGTTATSTSQLHEQFGYSAPLVLGNRVYLGIANHCDNPIQNGRVVVVDKNSGALVGGFGYQSTNTRGGGIWSSAAAVWTPTPYSSPPAIHNAGMEAANRNRRSTTV